RAFLPGIELHVPLAGIIDIAKERERLGKELGRVQSEIAAYDTKLSNDNFIAKAPENVVSAARQKKQELIEKAEKLRHSLDQLRE
ncbi:MAG: hypothetical protein HY801_02735, partial [Candidatus Lindowbacteria bacterium]|nr:hypothetical protein [Candidatus Lindowbacteria bacterium]